MCSQPGHINSRGRRCKAALLQMFALNDKKKKELASADKVSSNSDSDGDSDSPPAGGKAGKQGSKRGGQRDEREQKIGKDGKEGKEGKDEQERIDKKEGRDGKAGREGMESEQDSLQFSCHKCRASLFSQANVLSHALNAVRTVFKVTQHAMYRNHKVASLIL